MIRTQRQIVLMAYEEIPGGYRFGASRRIITIDNPLAVPLLTHCAPRQQANYRGRCYSP